MEAVCLEPEGNLATTISQLMQATTETATTATTHSNNNHCSIKSKDVSTHAHCKLSEQKHHRAGSCGPVCLKYWTSPNSQSDLFAGEVSGGENNSNLFPTPTATYLPTPTFAATYLQVPLSLFIPIISGSQPFSVFSA